MKKLLLCLITLQALFFSAAASDTPTFEGSRNVLICRTTQDNYASHYLYKGIREPFRIPWWNVINADELLSSSDITEANLAELATHYQADLVIVPFVNHWYFRQFQGFFPYNDDWYTEYSYRLSLYAYDKETASFRSYTVNGQGSKEAVDLNNPDDILRPAVKRLLDEFPYKRIPRDRPHSSSSINKSLSVSTTNGGAKIYKFLDGAVSI